LPVAKILRRFARAGRNCLFRLLSVLVSVAIPRGARDACLVMKIDALGDLFIWFSSGLVNVAIEARRDGRRSVILVRPELASFMQSLEQFDEVWPLDTKAFRHRIGYRLRTLARLRRYGFARVLQMRCAREYLQEDAITSVVGAREAFSPIGDLSNMTASEARRGDRLYTPLLQIKRSHELERNCAVTEALTGTRSYRYDFADFGELPRGVIPPFYVVAPGAGWGGRKWPAEKFAEVTRHLDGVQCVVAGTREEVVEGDIIAAAGNGLNLCGKLDLADLATLVRRASIVLANESGIPHMAAYFGVPSVAVLGGGHFGWFMPYPKGWPNVIPPFVVVHQMACFGCSWHCIYPHVPGKAVPCIDNVSLDAVVSAVRIAASGRPEILLG
jgi:ADP-heptose:LPS heptosyltransferase